MPSAKVGRMTPAKAGGNPPTLPPAIWRKALPRGSRPQADGFSALRRCARCGALVAKIATFAGYVGRSTGGEAGSRFGAAVREISRLGRPGSLLARFPLPVPSPGIAAQVLATPTGIWSEGERIVTIPCEQGFHGAGNRATPHGQGSYGLAFPSDRLLRSPDSRRPP